MNQKKNKGLKVAIIVILIIILILIAIIASLYFFTDLFRSNKESFFKYTSQLIQQEGGFLDNSLIQYLEKKKNTPYEDSGNIYFDISIPDMGQDNKLLNNFNITFSGKNDNSNSKNEQNISLNYSDNVNFPLYYRKVGDIQGIQTNYIGSRYVAIRDGEEIQGLEDFNLDFDLLGKSNIFNNIEIQNNDLQNLKTTYFDNILNQVDSNKFSQVTEQNRIGYKLTLTNNEFKDIIIQILETLKKDENTLSKLNEIFDLQQSSSKFNSTNIDSMIDDLNDMQLGDAEITVYKSNGKVSGIYIKLENIQVLLEKNDNNDELTYNFDFKLLENNDEILRIGLTTKFTGINSNSINENYELILEGNVKNSDEKIADGVQSQENISTENEKNEEIVNLSYKYIMNNNIKFIDNSNIEDFTDENSIILNDEDEQYVSNLMGAIQERIISVNKLQMEELGLQESQNPILYIYPSMLLSTFITNQTDNQVTEIEVTEFNNKFTLYEGTSQKGVTVRGLLSTIALNNGYDSTDSSSSTQENNNPKITEIHFDGEEYEVTDQNITLIKSMIETETLYRVEFELDANSGLIYRVVINKQ